MTPYEAKASTNRRVFLRDGGLALVSLGFAPSFLARTAAASAARQKLLIAIFQRGAVDGLNMVVPYGERAYYRSRPTHRRPQAGRRRRRARSRWLLRLPSAAGAAQADLRPPRAGRDSRVWVAGPHAVALRRAGLHGVGHARREEHRRGLAEPDARGQARRSGVALSRGGACADAPALVAGQRVGARHRPDRTVRRPRWTRGDGRRHVVRGAVRRCGRPGAADAGPRGV